MEVITKIMEKDCFISTPKPTKATILQKNDDRENLNGPIKLEFVDENSKWEFLKRANAMLQTEKIYCKLDESKVVRDK